jgi:antitoxin component YwqK of YwqJK toxin-antitoxin module
MPKVEQAMEIAQRKKVDALQYNSPMELIDQFGDVFKPKEKLINPDDVPTLSNKVQVPNTDITIYDVEDSEESRKNFRELMNSHFGKNANPWCLMQAEDGVLTEDSKDYWGKYNKYPKRAAFNNGKLIAFFASADEPTWWSRMDKPYSGIPVTRKIEGDALGRSATYIVSEDGGFDTDNFTEIHKGNKHNGLYEEWYDLDTKLSQATYKDGRIDGLGEKYHDNGRIAFQISYKDGKKDGKYLVFGPDGGLRAEGTYKEDLREGLYRGWHKNGNLKWRGNYINGELDGIVETWDENGNLEMREEYDNGSALTAERYANGKLNGWTTRWDKDGDIISREYYVDGKRNKLQEFGRKVAESFSIDRSQYLEGLEDDRAYASRWMDEIERKVKKNNPYGIALIIDDYDKFATDAE